LHPKAFKRDKNQVSNNVKKSKVMNDEQILNHINDCFQKIASRLDAQDESIGELLQRVTPVEQEQHRHERIFDTQDLCLLLNTSKRTIQRHRSMGLLKYHKLGRKVFYNESDVREYIENEYQRVDRMEKSDELSSFGKSISDIR